MDAGADRTDAAKRAPKVPNKPDIQKALNTAKGDDRRGQDGLCPWWHTVSTYTFQSAFADADRAWKNWLYSRTGRRKSRSVGCPAVQDQTPQPRQLPHPPVAAAESVA